MAAARRPRQHTTKTPEWVYNRSFFGDVERMLVQGDLPNQWFKALEWQKNVLLVKRKELDRKAAESRRPGVVFTEVLKHDDFTYKIGQESKGKHDLVLVNTKTGKTRKLWFPTQPPGHIGAQKRVSGPGFEYG